MGKEKSVSGQIGGQEFLNRSRQGFYAYPAGNRLAANSCTRTRWWIFSGPDLLSAVSGLEVRDSPDSKNRLSSNDGFVFLMGCDQRVRAYHQNYRKPSRRPQSGDRVPLNCPNCGESTNDIRLRNPVPALLDPSKKFLTAARVELRSEVGPPSGASTTTTFLYQLG